MMTLEEAEQKFIHDYNELEDCFLQYEYLLAFLEDTGTLKKSEYCEKNKIKGCQASVWIVCEYVDNSLIIRADSDTFIIKGILGVLISLLQGRTKEEITKYVPVFLSETDLGTQLSVDRFNGIHAIIEKIKTA